MKKLLLFPFVLILTTAIASFTHLADEHGAHTIDPRANADVVRVLDEYMATFNAKSLRAWEATYHFPHYRLASGQLSILTKAGQRDSASVFGPLQRAGWAYSRWDHRQVVQASDEKVHVDTRYSRYRADGSKIGSYESLYVLTKENGKWGVTLRSSFAE